MKAYCDYDVMYRLVNDKLLPQPQHAECPYPKITPVSGRIIFHGYNVEEKTVYIPGTCTKLDDGRGLFHGSYKLLVWAEEFATAHSLTLAFEVIPPPPQPVKKVKPAAEKKPKQEKDIHQVPKFTPRPEKPALSLQEIMAAKRAAKK